MSAFDIDSDVGLNRSATGVPAPKQILPFLYIGTVKTANEAGFLKREAITTVLDLQQPAPAKNDEDSDLDDDEVEFIEFKHKATCEYISHPPVSGDDDEEDESQAMLKYFKASFNKLKDMKAASKKVLVTSMDLGFIAAVVLSYMLQSSKAQDKYLPLAKAIEFIAAKDPLLNPAEYLLQLCILEEDLFDEISVKLPSNSRGTKGTVRKGGGKSSRGGRR